MNVTMTRNHCWLHENNDPRTEDEPVPQKAKFQKQTITDEIFDLIWNLDDQHLTAASRIVKAVIEYRQEMRREENYWQHF